MSLRLEITVHRRTFEARVSPQANCPSEKTHGHQYQRYRDPLRNCAFRWPKERDQGESGLAGSRGVVRDGKSAMGYVGEGTIFDFPPATRFMACWGGHCDAWVVELGKMVYLSNASRWLSMCGLSLGQLQAAVVAD